MVSDNIGTLIKQLRKEKGITAEELSFCSGCDVTTISRIETNRVEPSARVYEAIMSKLGFDPRIEYDIWSMSKDYKSYRCIKEINHLLCQKKYEEAKARIAVIEKDKSFESGLSKQYLLESQVVILFSENAPPETVIPVIQEALSITINPFNERHIDQYFLSYDEIILINNLAIQYSHMGKSRRAIDILLKTKTSMDKSFVDEGEKAKTYPMILYNLTKYLGLAGEYELSAELCQIARSVCIKNNKIRILSDILYNYAYALYYLGNIQDSKKYFEQSYQLDIVTENYKSANMTKDYVMKQFNITVGIN